LTDPRFKGGQILILRQVVPQIFHLVSSADLQEKEGKSEISLLTLPIPHLLLTFAI